MRSRRPIFIFRITSTYDGFQTRTGLLGKTRGIRLRKPSISSDLYVTQKTSEKWKLKPNTVVGSTFFVLPHCVMHHHLSSILLVGILVPNSTSALQFLRLTHYFIRLYIKVTLCCSYIFSLFVYIAPFNYLKRMKIALGPCVLFFFRRFFQDPVRKRVSSLTHEQIAFLEASQCHISLIEFQGIYFI